MKRKMKRIVSGVLGAIMCFSAFLQSPSAIYAAEETGIIPETGKVTFSVGEHGKVNLTDSKGMEFIIEPGSTYVLECEKDSVWSMEITANEDHEIAEYTVMHPDGSMDIWDSAEAETGNHIVSELTMSDGMKIKVTFIRTPSEAEETAPGTGTEKTDEPEITELKITEPERASGTETEQEIENKDETTGSGTTEEGQDGLYGYQSEGYVRTTIVPDNSEEMLIYFTDSMGSTRRMARAAASGAVSLVRGASYVYPSYWGSRSGSHRFTLNGNVAFCANPQEAEPGDGTYPSAYGTVSTTANDTVLRVLSFGYGGANDCTAEYLASLGRDTADDTRYALTHVAVAAAFGDSNPFYRANETCRNDVTGFINYINGLRFDSAGMYAQYVEVSGMQAIIRIVGDVRQDQKADLTIKKRSVTDLSDGRGEMLLTGAVFQLYGWDGSVPGYTRYICDSADNGDGTYTFKDVDISQGDGGHFLVKESTAPKGYEKTYYNFSDDDATDQSGWGGRQFVYENGIWLCQTLQNHEYPSWGFIFLDYPKQKQITVTKVDAGTHDKLTGAEFTLYGWNAAAKAYDINLGKFKDNGDGTYTSQKFAIDRADSRKYLVKETKAPAGYTLSSADTTDSDFKNYGGRQITLDADGNITGSPNLTFKNESDRGAVKIKKTSANPELTKDNTCYSFEGAEFGVYSDEGCKTSVGTLVTDENGDTEELSLRPGTCWIKETKAPTGYALNPNAKKAEVTGNKTVTVTFADIPQGDPVDILLGKVDRDTNSNKPEGSASLENAEFIIKYYDGFYTAEDLPEEAARSWILKTDADGYCNLSDQYKVSGDEFYKNTGGKIILPLGTITIRETKAPEGYLLNDELFIRQIKGTGSMEWVDTYNAPVIPETVIKGGVSIEKWDMETMNKTPQGAASLEGAEFTIINRSENPVIVDGESYAKDEAVMTIVTDENGKASTKADALPYGIYQIAETKAPEGYLASGANLTQTFTIRENGKVVNLNTEDTAAQNQVKRGDFQIIKAAAETYERMANVLFTITSKTTGESHAFVTDANGYYSTESSWNPHTRNTNRGETSEDGIWFGTSEPDDTKGALLYDTYTIEEQPCEANKGYELITFDIVISRDNVTVDLGTVTDELIPVISIQTTASVNGTGSSVTHAVTDLTVNDRVSYVNLTAGEKYTVKGTVMDKETGEPLLVNGEEVTAEKVFTPKESNGGVDMEFTFDASGFAGHELVVFEKLYLGKQEIASHEDWEDEDQTIEILNPEIGTKAADQATGSHVGHASGEVTIVDKVTYTGLIPGKTYQVKGTLMDKESGEPLLVNEEEITSEKEFTAVTGNGSIELTFTFDGLALRGKAVVAFEKLLYEGKEIAVHEDLTDEEQTVTYPEPTIGTTALDKVSGTHEAEAAKEMAVTDTVNLTGLIKGEEYTVRGKAWDYETRQPLLIDGKEVVSELTFTAEGEEGTVTLAFDFDGSELAGKKLVFCETLYYEGQTIAEESSLENKDQTIEIRKKTVTLKNQKTTDSSLSPTQPVKTGDDSPVLIWFMIGALSMAVCIACAISRKKRQESGKQETL